MTYRIELAKPAQKFIQKQPRAQQERLLRAIAKLPTEGDIKPLTGRAGLYRLRIGDYRVIYTVDNDVLLVLIMNVGNRGDVY